MNKDERIGELAAKLTHTPHTDRIWVKGEFQEMPVKRAPTELLYLNDDNRRFRAEAQGAAADLGRRLDPTSNPDDEQSIISLLLDRDPHVEDDKVVGKPHKESVALKVDWEKRGQERPFWIRPDGLVLNGNRRLAMIKRAQAELGDEFSPWVNVVVFSEDEYDDDVIFDLEATEQLTEGLKVRYSDINVLLTLRDAADRASVDWSDPESIKTTAARIQHLVNNDPSYAEIQLNAVKFMDLYLEDLGFPGEYHRLQRTVEAFREVGKTMSAVEADDESRADLMLRVMFAAIQSNIGYSSIRAIRQMWRNAPDEFDRLHGYVEELEDEAEPELEPEPDEPVPVEEDDDEDDDGDIGEAPAAPDYPRQAVKRALDNAVQSVNDARKRDKRSHVLNAASRLEHISTDDLKEHLGSGAEGNKLREAVRTIIGWADEMRPLVEDEADS
ncbi:MAG: hypothetical protein ACLPUT_14615 [Solirubrobacteraceae bacterium]